MKTAVSTKGQSILPAEFRQRDGVEPGQEFEVERVDRGEYRLKRMARQCNEGLEKLLLAARSRVGSSRWKNDAAAGWNDSGHCAPT
jgi:bifunctional DNA-binding transcriptional regulator/antitoxin component of YhaV-PrlF toxin-antitoxin module